MSQYVVRDVDTSTYLVKHTINEINSNPAPFIEDLSNRVNNLAINADNRLIALEQMQKHEVNRVNNLEINAHNRLIALEQMQKREVTIVQRDENLMRQVHANNQSINELTELALKGKKQMQTIIDHNDELRQQISVLQLIHKQQQNKREDIHSSHKTQPNDKVKEVGLVRR